MADIKVSVIIPVYNAEQYLEQCMESVVQQTLSEIEIICVNDGSTDRSPEILEAYRNRDSRIRVYTQPNTGVGSARNRGLDQAAGEYIVFLDSDDFFEPDALEKLYGKITEDSADVCVFGMKYMSEEYEEPIQYDVFPVKRRIPEKMPFSMEDMPETILNFAFNLIWNKMYRREFLNVHQLRFPDIKRGEDLCFVHLALCLAGRITVLREPLIHYRFFRQGSLTSTVHENPEDIIDSWFITADSLKGHGVYPERSFLNNILGSMVWLFKSIQLSGHAFESVYHRLKGGDLEKLGLVPREPGYYYASWHAEILEDLFREEPLDFLLSLVFILEIQNRKTNAAKSSQEYKHREKVQNLNGRIDQLKEQRNQDKETIQNLKRDKQAQKETIQRKDAALKEQKNRIRELENERKQLRKELNEIKASRSYRIGRMFTWVPRKIKAVIAPSGK